MGFKPQLQSDGFSVISRCVTAADQTLWERSQSSKSTAHPHTALHVQEAAFLGQVISISGLLGVQELKDGQSPTLWNVLNAAKH